MAERTGAVGSRTLRGQSGRKVAVAQAIAKGRRDQSGSSPLLPRTSSRRTSTFKPVVDGSVHKKDIKQKLAQERREEMRQQQDANKEMQLLEKERKAEMQYAKQMEEKQGNLQEHKEKDEQPRIAAEKKRKRESQDDRDNGNAVFDDISEYTDTVALRTKRFPRQSSAEASSENKPVAAAQAIAKQRRDQSGSSPLLPPTSSKRTSTFKPVIDGSVHKKDIKQKLAQERREEMRQQQDANKEMQLLEKERKAEMQYAKQMEEKQGNLQEHKEKDEQPRIAAEKKRKRESQEERDNGNAVFDDISEYTDTVALRTKRFPRQSSAEASSENKPEAAAQAIAKERRDQSGSSPLLPPTSSRRTSTFKPAIDGSVHKKDIKRKLAQERREEMRQQDANKEMQLLEKERKAKMQYAKQMEKKQGNLQEHKEKDEQPRIAAEKKRKRESQDDRDNGNAVFDDISEYTDTVALRTKRFPRQSSAAASSENKPVAAAQAIAKQRRDQSGSSPLLPPTSSKRTSTFKPVIDGSVHKKDIKQKLAQERREEMRRQQDANKEMQLLEKERKAEMQYAKQMEEKQGNLQEHKEKDEQPRIAAEKKRKRESQEERDNENAVFGHISEYTDTVGQHTERCPQQSFAAASSENKPVAAAQAIAKERRDQSGSSPLLPPTSSKRTSTFKPANQEMELLENERKAEMQYAKQMEEKQGNLQEHKEKDEQPRIAAEKKRKQESQEERDNENAVFGHISEYTNTVGQHTERCPQQSSVAASSENKPDMKRYGSSEKLEQEASASDKQRTVSSSDLQNTVSKKKTEKKKNLQLNRRDSEQNSPMETETLGRGTGAQLLYVDFRENDLLLRLTAPPKASIAKSRGAASLPFPGKGSTAGIHNPIIQYINTPSLSHNSDEMKKTTVSQKSTVAVSLPERVETPLKVSLEKPLSPSVGVASRLNEKMFPENVEASLEGSDHESHVSVDPTLEASTDLSCDSMDPSSEGGMDSVAKVSMEVSSPEASVDVFQEPSKEAFYEVNMETVPEESTEMSPVESVKVSPKLSPESPCDVSVETSPEVKMRDSPQSSEMGIEASSSLTKNQPSSQILRCISSTSAYGWFTPSLVFAKQNQKNQSLSFSSVMPKQSTAYFLSRKTTPVQSTMFERSAVGIGREKNEAAAKTAESSDAVNQKHVACDEFGKKSTPGTMSAKETTKILADKGCLAGEQREKEERLQKEMEQRKEKDTAKKVAEDQEEEFSKLDDGQQLKGIEKKTERPDQDDKNVLQQRGDAKIKAQEDAEKRQKERQQIFQNLKERMERRKRILEIIKERRQTDSNASKVMETLSKDICEENKADNEDQSESDNKDSYHN